MATLGARAELKPDTVVALDGSGQYKSLQEAISAAPMRTDPTAAPWVILVKAGTYNERIYVQRERGNIHVIGEDRETTVVTYDLNANLPGPDGKPIGTFRTPTVQIDGDGMTWENITIANHAGPVGQALALRADGDRLTFRHCRFLGWQDTILVNRGRHYFVDSYIEGHVDFIFGAATAYFERCHIHALRGGYLTAASTPKDAAYGYVFADCKITGADGVKTFLGRPWRDFAKTVFVRTEMADVVRAEGWNNWNKPHAEQTTFYAEFGSTGPGANDAARVKWAKPLRADEAAALTPSTVLAGADGWNPAVAAPAKKIHLVLVGDSTVTEESGWGLGFRQWVGPGATLTNTARGGRSSKSFRDEGHWDKALALKGDYYLIQFGHNDQPGKGPDRETDPTTTFPANLARFVDEVRAAGGQPILVTSLTRRTFDPSHPGKITSTLTPYADAVKRVGTEKNVPVIDLHASSAAYCEKIGPEATAKFNLKNKDGTPDRTHLDAAGSLPFAQLVVEELRRTVPALAPVLRTEAGMDRDVEYGRADGVSLKLDAHTPAGAGPFPIAILIHGGGWSSGDKAGSDKPGNGADITPWFAPLSEAQFTWFSINYRMAPAHRWPACFEDVQTAIRWVKAHAAEFKGDPSRIAIFGHSAGGHLATLAGVLGDNATRVQAVVGFAPVTDFEFELPARGGLGPAMQALHNQPKEPNPTSLAILRETAPINHVQPGLPPFLLLHGDADKTVPYQTSLNFQAKLRASGVVCDLITLPGAGHGLLTWEIFLPDYNAQLIAWLQRTLATPSNGQKSP